MIFKKILIIFFSFFSISFVYSTENELITRKFYGYVRNEFYVNSRQNYEALDGTFNIFPLPVQLDADAKDKNKLPSSEMLAISSRLGLDVQGGTLFGAKSSAKIECDFAGVKQYYYLIRLRQAYIKLNWEKTELLVGQTWHPLFTNLKLSTPALSAGSPFQPFNRSPQVRLTRNLSDNFSLITAISYQMQYLTQGPLGASSSYMKTGLLPAAHLCINYKTKKIGLGVGFDGKSLLINKVRFNSGAAVAYASYTNKKLHVSAKSVLGQNMSEYLMLGGYGLSVDATTAKADYTNINTSTSWISVAYGAKVQIGVYGGLIQNLGSNKDLQISDGKFTVYGYGFYTDLQQQVDQLYRIAPNVTYNLPNFRLGFEYELTTAKYGNIQADGNVSSPYSVNNHRIMATISYLF